jgi:hypothetical protein
VVLLFLLLWPALAGRIPVYWDLGSFHLPIRSAYAGCLRSGDSFDWLPAMHNGVFITGEGEHGPYHPLHLLLYRCLPLAAAFALEVFLAFAFLFAGMVLFLRRHAGTAGAFLGAIVCTFSANNFSHSFHVNYIAVIAHLPWLLWLQEGLFRDVGRPRWRRAGAIALLTGSQLLLGHPQVLSYSLLAESLYVLFMLPSAQCVGTAVAAWTAAKALGAAVGGAQVLATLTFLANSNRSSFDPFLGSLPPALLLQLLVPAILVDHAPGWMLEGAYAGAVPLLLALWYGTGLVRRRPTAGPVVPERVGERRLGWYALTLGAVATWLALGKYGGLYYLQTLLPVVGQFRAPARYLNLLDFALALLAGLALGRLTTHRGRPDTGRQRLLAPWLLTAAAVAAAVAFRIAYPGADGPGLEKRFLSGAACFVAAALLLTAAVRGRSLAVCGLVLFAAWDLYHFSLCHPHWGLSTWKDTLTPAEYLGGASLPPGPAGRCFDISWNGTHNLLRGVRIVNGYLGGIEPRKRLDYEQVEALRLSAATWYHERDYLPAPPPLGLEPVGQGWYRVPQPLPRVRLVSRTVLSSNPKADLARLHLESEALVERPLDLEAGPAGSAVLVEEQPGRMQIEVEAPGKQLLVVAESHDPGWQATIDGQSIETQRVNADFLGCIVGPGRHTVVLCFAPRCLVWGRAVSLAGLAAALLMAAWGLRRRPLPAI